MENVVPFKETKNSKPRVLDALVIGTGFGGLCMGIQLKEKGYSDFLLLEKADSVGGTWRDNKYPGCACDVQSYLYSFSFAQKNDWSRMYGPQEEIYDYLDDCVEKFGLAPYIRFNTTVKEARFSAPDGIWTVLTESGETYQAKILVTATGGLSKPALPNIKGIENFDGTIMHSAKWDSSVDLKGKKVAVIGTGASAIQIIPTIEPDVKEMMVFQRSAPWVVPKPDRAISPIEHALYKLSPPLQNLVRASLYFRLEARVLALLNPGLLKVYEGLAKNNLTKVIKDPELLRKLTPNTTVGCKRVLLSNDYYPALQKEHVKLINASVQELKGDTVIADNGVEYKPDVVIAATGFQASEAMAPFPIYGLPGRDLNAEWRRGGEAYLGITVNGYPNMFMIFGPNTTLGHSSMIYMFESQVRYILSAMEALEKKPDVKYANVKIEKQSAYNKDLQERLTSAVWASGCKSWYINAEGKNTTLWPGFTFEYALKTLRFDSADYNMVSNTGKAIEPNWLEQARQLLAL